MSKKDQAAAPPGAPKPEAPKTSKDASLNGKKFDLSESERDSCGQLLEKVASLRQQADQIEQGAMLKARKYVLERIGASPETVARAQVQVHRSAGQIVAIEIVEVAPAPPPAPEPPPPSPDVKMLKGGKRGKKAPPDAGLRAARARQYVAPGAPPI